MAQVSRSPTFAQRLGLRTMLAVGVDRHALDERRQDLGRFAADRLDVQRFAQPADLSPKSCSSAECGRIVADGTTVIGARSCLSSLAFSGTLCQELQQGRARHRGQHVGGETSEPQTTTASSNNRSPETCLHGRQTVAAQPDSRTAANVIKGFIGRHPVFAE
jgi:hypothetical protein